MYARQVDSKTLTLRVSGKLWMRSLIMSDVETNTEWSHIMGRAMKGPLKDKTLDPIHTDMLTWKAWRDEFPDTTLLNMSRTSKNYTRDFYREPRKFLFGFQIAGKSYALAMSKLIDRPVHAFEIDGESFLATFDKPSASTRLFNTKLGDRKLAFTKLDDKVMQDTETKSKWNIADGKSIDGPLKGSQLRSMIGIMSYRKAWTNFYPNSIDVNVP